MKNNKMMRVASALLVAVLLTTCVISGTFAKYTTYATGSDTAHVAKWGVNVVVAGTTFATSYDDTAVSSSTTKIVAPGTSGSMAAITLSGTPEVSVNVKYAATLTLENWTINGSFYCPIIIRVGSDTIDGKAYTSASEFKAAVEQKVAAHTQNYQPNTDLSTVADQNLAITWEWAFDTNNDVNDTALGNAAANGDKVPTISLEVSCTVTQVD